LGDLVRAESAVGVHEPARAPDADLSVVEVVLGPLGVGVPVGLLLGEAPLERLTARRLLGGRAEPLAWRPPLRRGQPLVERVVGLAAQQRVLVLVLTQVLSRGRRSVAWIAHASTMPLIGSTRRTVGSAVIAV